MAARDGAAKAQSPVHHTVRQTRSVDVIGFIVWINQLDCLINTIPHVAKVGPVIKLWAISAQVSSTASARCEICTQMSVTIMRAPVRAFEIA